MLIRAITEEEVNQADEIMRTAFGIPEQRSADLRRYLELQPDGWFFALESQEPVGLVGAIDYGTYAYIGMMSVHPNHQRRGIGRALMAHVVEWLDRRGTPAILLDATPKGYPLYTSLGFVEEDRACYYQQTQPMHYDALPRGVDLLQVEDLQELSEFDAPIFGANRKAVFCILLRDFPQRAFVLRNESGGMAGFVFRSERRLGPWVACTPQDTETLLRAALTLPPEGKTATIAPEANQDARQVLGRYGFELTFAIRHMRRGAQSPPRRRALVYGQTSFAIG